MDILNLILISVKKRVGEVEKIIIQGEKKKSSKSVAVKHYSITKRDQVCMTSVTVITPAERTLYANYSFN